MHKDEFVKAVRRRLRCLDPTPLRSDPAATTVAAGLVLGIVLLMVTVLLVDRWIFEPERQKHYSQIVGTAAIPFTLDARCPQCGTSWHIEGGTR